MTDGKKKERTNNRKEPRSITTCFRRMKPRTTCYRRMKPRKITNVTLKSYRAVASRRCLTATVRTSLLFASQHVASIVCLIFHSLLYNSRICKMIYVFNSPGFIHTRNQTKINSISYILHSFSKYTIIHQFKKVFTKVGSFLRS